MCLLSGICRVCLYLRLSAGQPCVAMPCWCYWDMAGGTWRWERRVVGRMRAMWGMLISRNRPARTGIAIIIR